MLKLLHISILLYSCAISIAMTNDNTDTITRMFITKFQEVIEEATNTNVEVEEMETVDEQNITLTLYGNQSSIYDFFTEDEVYLIQRCVETEVNGGSIETKSNVASVIFNRLQVGYFGDTITDVITAENQFVYIRTEITDSTKKAIEQVWANGDTTNGCLFFHSYKKAGKFFGEYQFTDKAGHHFYK